MLGWGGLHVIPAGRRQSLGWLPRPDQLASSALKVRSLSSIYKRERNWRIHPTSTSGLHTNVCPYIYEHIYTHECTPYTSAHRKRKNNEKKAMPGNRDPKGLELGGNIGLLTKWASIFSTLSFQSWLDRAVPAHPSTTREYRAPTAPESRFYFNYFHCNAGYFLM